MPSVSADPTVSTQERARAEALRRYDILDTACEDEFDDIAALAAEVCQTPIAVVNFVDTSRQFFKAEVGLGVRETPLETSFCGHAILTEDLLVVPDATADPRFSCNPLVTQEGGLRFYAGALLRTADGFAIGTVCVLDTQPRTLDAHQIRTLKLLARQVMTQLELRAALRSAHHLEARHRQILNSSVDYAIIALDLGGNVISWNHGAENVLGWREEEIIGKPAAIIFNAVDRAIGIPSLEMAAAREHGRGADERWHVRKDGSRFFALGEMMPLKADTGQHVGYVKILRDRTRARRQSQRLALLSQASAALLSADDPAATLRPILEGGADTIGFERCFLFDVDADGRMRLRQSVGVPEETQMALRDVSPAVPICGIIAETGAPLVLAELQNSDEPRYQTARSTGVQAYAGLPIFSRERLVGVISFASVELTVFDAEALMFFQAIARLLSVARERVDDAQALRDAEQRLRLAQEAGGIGTFELEAATGKILPSPEFCRIFGVEAHNAMDAGTFEKLIVPQDRHLRSDHASRLDGSAPTDVEYRIHRGNDGALRWVARRAEYMRDESGNIISMLGTVEDITESRSMAHRQAALLELGNVLRQAVSRDDMISHACRIAREALSASRAGYAYLDRRAGKYVVSGETVSAQANAMHGTYELASFARTTAQLQSGDPVILNDIGAENMLSGDLEGYLAISVAAQISIPQLRKGNLAGSFFIHQAEPRRWTAEDIDFMRRVADRLYSALDTAHAEEEQAVLNRELSHRLKNSLAMIQAIASQTLRGRVEKPALDDFMKRLQILSTAHNVLLHRNWEAGSIRETISATLGSFTPADRLHVIGPDIQLGPKTTLTLSMLLHELGTNALKYGALSVESGSVTLKWDCDEEDDTDPDLKFEWRETGGPEVVPPAKTGFGSRLIELGLTGTGGVVMDYPASGVIVQLTAALREAQNS